MEINKASNEGYSFRINSNFWRKLQLIFKFNSFSIFLVKSDG
nr:MAG TPA: MATRIX PROTEIN ASSEMBLY, VIRAL MORPHOGENESIS, LAGOS.75A [Caudoviricetes sp.]